MRRGDRGQHVYGRTAMASATRNAGRVPDTWPDPPVSFNGDAQAIAILQQFGELQGEIWQFCLLCFSVSICYAYLFHQVLRVSPILQLLLIANFGGCSESTWRQFWGGLTVVKKETRREFQPTSMTSSGGGFIQDREFHLPDTDGEDKDLVSDVFEDILQGEFIALPALVDAPVLAAPTARPPRTRSETRVHHLARPTRAEDGHVRILPQRQPWQERENNLRCGAIPQQPGTTRKKKSQPLLAPTLLIGEEGVNITNDIAKPKEKRKYQKRLHQQLGEASNSSSQGRRRAVGCPMTSRAVGQFAASTLFSNNSSDYSDKALPRPSVFFTPPETRSKYFERCCVNWGEITKNLFPEGRPTIECSQVVPQSSSCLLKIALINMNWGGEVLENPCGFAFGKVLHMIQGIDGEDLQLCCNFGGDFGIQTMAQRHCEFLPGRDCGGDRDNTEAGDSIEPEAEDHPSFQLSSGGPPSRGHGTCVSQTGRHPSSGAQGRLNDCSSEDDWQPNIDDLCSSGDGYSDGDSFNDVFPEDKPTTMLGELGMYGDGPREGDEEFLSKYSEAHWHAKTWTLLPRHAFIGPTPGPIGELDSARLAPIECFLQIWNEQIQRRLVYHSNTYANYVDPQTGTRKGGVYPSAPITLLEYRQFCGICILMGIRKQPAIRDYWQRVGSSLHCASIASTMSRFRFEYILRCLYMVPKGSFVTNKDDPAYDPLGKCRWILEAVTATFKALWNPGPYVSIDECMIGYNGKYCSFKQYMPMKPITHGIKLWVLANSKTKFVWNLEVYVGATNERRGNQLQQNSLGMGGAVVSRLTAGMDGMFYRVAMDNFFSSVKLFDNLLQRGLYAIGTTRQQRKGFPSSLSITRQETRGSLQVRVHRDRQMAAIHWQDTKGVHFLLTSEDPMVSGGVSVLRNKGPQWWPIPTSPIQLAYSEHMRGVDVSDQLRGSYSVQIATKKWWHRVYFFALDTALTNAYIMYRESCGVRGVRPKVHRDFNLEVAYCLMGLPVPEVGNGSGKMHARSATTSSRRGTSTGATHMPHWTTNRRVCFVCRKRTSFECTKCPGTRLCKLNCFEVYHEGPPTL